MYQGFFSTGVRAVQFIASCEVITRLFPVAATAMKVPLANMTHLQKFASIAARAVQVIASGDVTG